jgi:hypothetical protein
MSWTLDGPGGAAVMRAADAEAMSTGQVSARLLEKLAARRAERDYPFGVMRYFWPVACRL